MQQYWRWAVICTLCGSVWLLVGCPRVYGPGQEVPPEGTATHPWEQPGWEAPQPFGLIPAPEGNGQSGRIELPERRGPALAQTDTLDEALLPGRWLQVCQVSQEQLALIPPQEMDLLELASNGQAAYHLVREGKVDRREGNWTKQAPGVLGVAIGGGTALPFYGQLYSGQFLYLWNYENLQGWWYVRLPEQGAAQLGANHFTTTRGELLLKDVVMQQFSGELRDGENVGQVTGYYINGVMTLRWEDPAHNAAGYAALLVTPDFSSLEGVWWLDDYEASPFGGAWSGNAG